MFVNKFHIDNKTTDCSTDCALHFHWIIKVFSWWCRKCVNFLYFNWHNTGVLYLSQESSQNVSSHLSTDWPTGSTQPHPEPPELKTASAQTGKTMGLVTAKWHSTALQTKNDCMTDDRMVTLTVTRFEVFLNVWPAGWLWLAESSLCSLSSGTDAPISAAPSLHPTDWVSAGGQQGAVQPEALRTKRQRPLTHRNHAF